MLNIDEKDELGGITLVKFVGEIDFRNFKTMKEYFSSMLQKGKTKLVVDLGKIDFLDSSGLGVLVSLQAEAKRKLFLNGFGSDFPIICRSVPHVE